MFKAFLGSLIRFALAYWCDELARVLVDNGVSAEDAKVFAEQVLNTGIAAIVVVWAMWAHRKTQKKIKNVTAENRELKEQITWNERTPHETPKVASKNPHYDHLND